MGVEDSTRAYEVPEFVTTMSRELGKLTLELDTSRVFTYRLGSTALSNVTRTDGGGHGDEGTGQDPAWLLPTDRPGGAPSSAPTTNEVFA